MTDRERLSRYLEGELAEDERLAVEATLAADPAAAAELEALRQLVAEAAELSGERQPPRDLWAGIAERIRADETAFRRPGSPLGGRRWLAAAVVLVVLGGSFAVGRLTSPRRDAPDAVAEAERTRTAAVVPTEAAVPTEVDWAAASRDLFRALEETPGEMDPATEEVVRRNLEIIDEAVREIRAALDEDPRNAGLQRLLTAEYHRRSAVLRRAALGAT